eukprot:gb/GFBE01010423.1/.p2 GENE.gb/GFBE01010423.1/~~gb/GFBE01010423.1/.p2  ORF type:complete len:100 (-),score=6.89 gb/GFBE01010423.1/:7-306(-)
MPTWDPVQGSPACVLPALPPAHSGLEERTLNGSASCENPCCPPRPPPHGQTCCELAMAETAGSWPCEGAVVSAGQVKSETDAVLEGLLFCVCDFPPAEN